MCGLVYVNNLIKQPKLLDIICRGPDDQNTLINDFGYFFHSRLITKPNNITQPAVNNHGVLLYNGTQYDIDNNDTDYIIKNLSNNIEKNLEFLKTLNGDFAICFVTEDYIFLAKDCFGTKPLFWGEKEKTFIAASTELSIKSLGIQPYRLPDNFLFVFSRDGKFLEKHEITIFNLDQNNNSLDLVFENFEKSVFDRFVDNCTVNLSSGHDSGAINACLSKYNKKYDIVYYLGEENEEIYKKRFYFHKKNQKLLITSKLFGDASKFILDNGPDFLVYDLTVSPLAKCTADYTVKRKTKVNITGTGADELFSDYGFNGYAKSARCQFGGIFPDDLRPIFPYIYNALYGLYIHLPMTEYCNSLNGIDSRHPYLDKKLYQSWINTSVKLKNKEYKHWQSEYMRQLNYPFTFEKISTGQRNKIKDIIF